MDFVDDDKLLSASEAEYQINTLCDSQSENPSEMVNSETESQAWRRRSKQKSFRPSIRPIVGAPIVDIVGEDVVTNSLCEYLKANTIETLRPPSITSLGEILRIFSQNTSVTEIYLDEKFSGVGVDAWLNVLNNNNKRAVITSFSLVNNPNFTLWKKLVQFIENNKVLKVLNLEGCLLSDNDLDCIVDAIATTHSLEYLNLTGCRITEKGISVLKKIPKIKYLHIGKFQFDTVGTGFSSICGNSVVELNLENSKLDAIGSKLIEALADAPCLKRLNLSGTDLTDVAITSLAKTIKIRCLSHLTISRLKISPNAANLLGESIAAAKSFVELDLSYSDLTNTKPICSSLIENTSLKSLNLCQVCLTEADVKAIGNLIAKIDSFSSLNVQSCGISKIDPIIDEWQLKKQQLEFFEYGGNFIGTKGAKIGLILSQNYKLTYLGLGFCPDLTNDLVRPIAQVLQEENHTLTSLDISGTRITGQNSQKCVQSIGIMIAHSRCLRILKLDDVSAKPSVLTALSTAVSEGLFMSDCLVNLSMKNCSVVKEGRPFLWALQYHPMEFLDMSGIDGPPNSVAKEIQAAVGGKSISSTAQFSIATQADIPEVANLMAASCIRNPRYKYVTPLEKRRNFLTDIFTAIVTYISEIGEVLVRKDIPGGGLPRITVVSMWVPSNLFPLVFPTSELMKKSLQTVVNTGITQAAKMKAITGELEKFWNKACPPTANKLLYFAAHPNLIRKEQISLGIFFGKKFSQICDDKQRVWTYTTEPNMLAFWKELGFVIDRQSTIGTKLQVWSLIFDANPAPN